MSEAIAQAASSVGAVVRRRRRELGMSQEALAARMASLGLKSWRQTTVTKVEAARNPRAVSLQEALALTAALGLIGIQDLMGNGRELQEVLVREYTARAKREFERVKATYAHQFESKAGNLQDSLLAASLSPSQIDAAKDEIASARAELESAMSDVMASHDVEHGAIDAGGASALRALSEASAAERACQDAFERGEITLSELLEATKRIDSALAEALPPEVAAAWRPRGEDR